MHLISALRGQRQADLSSGPGIRGHYIREVSEVKGPVFKPSPSHMRRTQERTAGEASSSDLCQKRADPTGVKSVIRGHN